MACVCFRSECRTALPADIVFLVDESWSVGPSSFGQIKEFIAEVIRSFQSGVIGSEGVRFGVTLYADVPRYSRSLTHILPDAFEGLINNYSSKR